MTITVEIPFYHTIREKKAYKKVSIFYIFSKNRSHKTDAVTDRKTGNRVYRRFPKDSYIDLKKYIEVLIKSKRPKFRTEDPKCDTIMVGYHVYKPTQNGDAFNLLDGLADAVKTVIGIDDRYFGCDGIYSHIDKINPRVVLTISQDD